MSAYNPMLRQHSDGVFIQVIAPVTGFFGLTRASPEFPDVREPYERKKAGGGILDYPQGEATSFHDNNQYSPTTR
jgi:hypothetical protein